MRETIAGSCLLLGAAVVLLSAPCLAGAGDLESGAQRPADAKGAAAAPKPTGPSAKPRDTGRPCPKLTPEQYPALLFRKPVDGGRRSNLAVVHFVNGRPRYDYIPQGRYRRVIQVDTAAFLLCTASHNKNGEVLLADLRGGKLLSLKRGVGDLRLLRANLKRRRAVFAAMNVREGFVDLVELDLKTFNMPSTIRLTHDKFGGSFSEIVGVLQISPDFKRLAYAARLGGQLHDTHYELRVLQIATGKTSVLDGKVRVVLSPLSSSSHGRPPVAWLDNNRVLYQHHLDALSMLKIADAGKGTVANLLEAKLPGTLSGGTLRLCPFSGKVIYHEQYTVDLAAKRLVKIANPTDQPRYRVLISPSGKHHAYVVIGGRGRFQGRTVMVKTKALAKPTAVSRAGIPGPRPLAWIEKLPAGKPDSRPSRRP